MKLTEVRLINLGPFEDATLELGPGTDDELADVHVLVGPNGAGKTTLLNGIAATLLGGGAELQPVRAHPVIVAVAVGPARVALAQGFSSPKEIDRVLGGTWARLEPFPPFASPPDSPLADEVRKFNRRGSEPLEFFCFWYRAERLLNWSGAGQITNMTDSPLHSAPQQLLQWVLNNRAKAAMVRKEDEQKAERLEAQIRKLENVASDIFGSRIEFRERTEPLGVDLLVDGAIREGNVMPDGFKGLMSVLGDVLMRLDRITWTTVGDLLSREFLILWDEFELHLHPGWQRRALQVIQRLFPRAQIILSTHSPFVVNAAIDAQIHVLSMRDGKSVIEKPLGTQAGTSVSTVVREVLGIPTEFGPEAELRLGELRTARNRWLRGELGAEAEFDEAARKLVSLGDETAMVVARERQQILRRLQPAS